MLRGPQGPRVLDVAPNAYQIEIIRAKKEPTSLLTATGGYFEVTLPDGSEAVWPGLLSDGSPGRILLTHIFEAGDLPVSGTYLPTGVITFASGEVHLLTQELYVRTKQE